MNNIIKEIIKTSLIVVENKVDLYETLIIRPTDIIRCNYCGCLWNAVVYEGVKYRICSNCVSEIKEKRFELQENFQIYLKAIENKKRVLEDIIEVGFNPDRTWQTQLADTLCLFKQPN